MIGWGSVTIACELSGLTQNRGRRTVLRGLTFSVGRGVTGLLGPNGAGKTTLLETIVTLLPPRGGALTVCGWDAASPRSRSEIRRQTGFLPQSFQAIPGFTVRDFVTYVAWTKGLDGPVATTAVGEALEAVDLHDRAQSKVRTLSGGMRQRLGIACAIVHSPAFLVLYEPTVGLDPAQRLEFRRLIRDLSAETAVLTSTHLTDDVAAVCDQVVVMSDGQTRYSGSVDGIVALGSGGGEGRQELGATTAIEQGYLRVLASDR